MVKKPRNLKREKVTRKKRAPATIDIGEQIARAGAKAAEIARKIDFALSADKTTLTISVATGAATTDVALTTEQVDSMIASMAKQREQMGPPISVAIPVGRQVRGVLNPRYRIGSHAKTGGTTLVLRHPGLGWLGYFFPRPETERIKGFLHAQAGTLQ